MGLKKKALEQVNKILSNIDTQSVYSNVRKIVYEDFKGNIPESVAAAICSKLSEDIHSFINTPIREAKSWVDDIIKEEK